MKCQLLPGSWVSGTTAPLVPLAILILGKGRHIQVWVAWLRNPLEVCRDIEMVWVRDKQLSGNHPFLKLAEMAQADMEGEAFLGIQVGEHPQIRPDN